MQKQEFKRKVSCFLKITAFTCLSLLFETAAWADILPGAAMPETVSKYLKAPKLQVRPQALPSIITQPQPEAMPGGEEAKKITFMLNRIILEGNHVYSDQQLEVLYQSKLHHVITVADLFEIVQNITIFYRNNGYILSRALLPPQHVKNGIVRVRIIEGFIDQVNVTDIPKGALCQIIAIGSEIKKCPPLLLSRMEKYLLIANEVPGTSVKAVLSPSKQKPGGSDLNLVTENRSVTGYLSYDNYGTRYIGPQQMTANVAFNSFATSGDATQVTEVKTPRGGELNYLDINYSLPVSPQGTRFTMGDTRAHTHPLFVLAPADVDGLNENYYASLTHPLIRTRAKTLTAIVNFNYLDSDVTALDEKLYMDHIRSLGLGLSYNFADRFHGINTIYGDIRQGLPIFGYSSDTNPLTAETSRPGGHANYTKIDFQASRIQAIKGPVTLFALVKGQWAFNPLLASEQFTFGGSQLGRGYDVAELIGDKGLAGSLEVRYDLNFSKIVQNIQFYIFYDIGKIWNYKLLNISLTPRKLSGTSTGIGARFYFTKYISGNVMWTQTLTKQVAAEELIGEGKRPRVFFSMVASFG